MLTWTACIATFERRQSLRLALAGLLTQTRPPEEIVVVDASDDWRVTWAEMWPLFEGSRVRLSYRPSEVRSSAVQRNLALETVTSDVVMFFDDDSFLHPTCAEELMALYEADGAGEVAAIGATLVDENPFTEAVERQALDCKRTGRGVLRGMHNVVLRSHVGRWINRHVLCQSPEALFLRYDGVRTRPVPEALAARAVLPVAFLQGCAMSARREIAQATAFDPALRYYAACEDLDFIYRVAAHGAVLRAERAHLHHFEAASGRIARKRAIAFQLLNMTVFLKRHAADPARHRGAMRRMMWRRLLGECLKDGLSRRWEFPQVRGVLLAMRFAPEIWAQEAGKLDLWYPPLQKRIMGDTVEDGKRLTAGATGALSLADEDVY